MLSIPKKVAERLSAGLKRFQPILAASKARNEGECDTVMIVTGMLACSFRDKLVSQLPRPRYLRKDRISSVRAFHRRIPDLKRLILSINGGRAARLADASRLYKCEIPFEVNPKIGFKESYRQFNARLKEWAAEMCFVVVASHWIIRVYGLGDLKIAFYQNVLPSDDDEPCSVCGRFHAPGTKR